MMLIDILRRLRPQIVLLTLLSVLGLGSLLELVPTLPQLLSLLEELVDRYGLPAVAIASVVENAVGLNSFFPGSVIILSTMALSHGNPQLAFTLFVVIYGTGIGTQVVNWAVGRAVSVGSDKDSRPFERRSFASVLVLCLTHYWHPHLGALMSYRMGSEGFRFFDFFRVSAPTLFFWNSFWAVVMYNFGQISVEGNTLVFLVYLYCVVWFVFSFIRERKNLMQERN